MPSVRRTSFRQRILVGLLVYAAVLSIAVIAHGHIVNEHAEQLVWQSLLNSEFDHIAERGRQDPSYRWENTDSISLYGAGPSEEAPIELRSLPPGVHDDVMIHGTEHVVLVRESEGRMMMMALDITEVERNEDDMWWMIFGSAVALIVAIGIAIAFGANRLVRPLARMAARIGDLRPDLSGQRIDVPDKASAELVVIADALNDYLQRNDRFVERERAFIDTTSHELRTPIAVITGATEIALEQQGLTAATRGHLARIQRTAREVDQMISLLLVLAKDPERLSTVKDYVPLDQLLHEIVEDHRHLTRSKDLSLTLTSTTPITVLAPLPIVQAAIGNLLRNAIENSDRGEIIVRLEPPATVTISDPGHGMTPEEISAVYARLARGGGDRGGAGIGLDLISRLCEHLGWRLALHSDPDKGTTAVLAFSE